LSGRGDARPGATAERRLPFGGRATTPRAIRRRGGTTTAPTASPPFSDCLTTHIIGGRAVRVDLRQRHDPAGIAIRQLIQENGFRDTEDRRTCANAERESDYCGQSKDGAFSQGSRRISEFTWHDLSNSYWVDHNRADPKLTSETSAQIANSAARFENLIGD